MKVAMVCKKLVVTVQRSDEVSHAARLIREKHLGYLVVVETDDAGRSPRPVGVLTDRDLVVSLLARDLNAKSVLVGDVMTSNPITVLESDSVETALHRMRDFGIRRVPVVSYAGELVGVLATDDILQLLAGDTTDLASILSHERSIEGLRRS